MSIIENDDKIKLNDSVENRQVYELPAVVRKEKEEMSFEKALFIAFILHPLIVLILLLSTFILKLLGIDFTLFHKPDLKPKDIEFVLVEKEAPPIDKNTKNRADKNSQAGGKHDPNRPVSLPQASAPKSEAKKPTSPAPSKPAAQPKQQPKQQPKTQPAPSSQAPKTPAPKVETPQPQPTQKPKTEAPKPTAPKPTATSVTPPKPNPASSFNIPTPPKSSIPQVTQPTTAPVTSAPKSAVGGTSGGTGSGAPSPSFSPTKAGQSSGAGGTGSGAGGGGKFSNGTGTGKGNVGNPGPGNPNGAPGIDAIKEPDFGPYMKELQRRIKMNWDPPKGNESKRVILLFSIAKDGRLLNIKVHRSSGLQAADNAAINAVKLTAPFRPLPPEFKGNSVDIQFTFDYNVFGVNSY